MSRCVVFIVRHAKELLSLSPTRMQVTRAGVFDAVIVWSTYEYEVR